VTTPELVMAGVLATMPPWYRGSFGGGSTEHDGWWYGYDVRGVYVAQEPIPQHHRGEPGVLFVSWGEVDQWRRPRPEQLALL
jgi:hypothetical protein